LSFCQQKKFSPFISHSLAISTVMALAPANVSNARNVVGNGCQTKVKKNDENGRIMIHLFVGKALQYF
jgi:hypothetical protein